MPIQWEPGTVYIPSDAVLNLRERTVSLPDPSGNGTVVIGHMNSESSMIPTNAFRTRFPDQWALCTQENGGGQKSAGMFALLLGISRKTGLYEALSRSFGVEVCNTVLDAAASLLRGAVSPADPEMSGQVLFSEQRRDADWYNTFLTRNWDRGRNSFRDKWMDACRNRLGPDCLVCADPEGPSREGEDPAAYVRVVDAGTGIPLVMFCGNPDSALEEALKVVDARNLNLRAVLLGPYLGTQERLDWLRHRGCDYALRLPPDSDIFQTLHREFSDRIRCDITSCIGPDSRISGIQQMRMLYPDDLAESKLTLFYDPEEAARQQIRLFRACRTTVRGLDADPDREIPEALTDFIHIEQDNGSWEVVMDSARVNREAWRAGFSAYASSDIWSPQKLLNLYALKDRSLSVANGIRHWSDYGQLLIFFVAGILNAEIMQACGGEQPEQKLRSLDGAVLRQEESGEYRPVLALTPAARALLQLFDVYEIHFTDIADLESERLRKTVAFHEHSLLPPDAKRPVSSKKTRRTRSRRKGAEAEANEAPAPEESFSSASPETPVQEAEAEEEQISEPVPAEENLPVAEPQEEPRRGRRRGSRKAQESTAQDADASGAAPESAPEARNLSDSADGMSGETETDGEPAEQPKKRRGGRPKGSRNKKTLERLAREAQEAQEQAEAEEPGPSVPEEELPEAAAEEPETAGRQEGAGAEPEAAEQPKKRRGGRPKGSRNRKTPERLAQEELEPDDSAQPAPEDSPDEPVAEDASEETSVDVLAEDTIESPEPETVPEEAAESAAEASDASVPEEEPEPKKRRGGRRKGTRNKKTLERLAQEALEQDDLTESAPEDSEEASAEVAGESQTDESTAATEPAGTPELSETEGEPEQPRKRRGGRPKGSRNKKTLERLAREALEQDNHAEPASEVPAEESTAPEASTEALLEDHTEDYDDNTEPEAIPKSETAPAESAPEPELTGTPDTEEEPEPQPKKRRGGRPKGSRNKKTLERLAQEAQEAQEQGSPSESAPEAPAEESTIPESSTEALPEDHTEDYDDNTEPEAVPESEAAPAESAPEPELTGTPDTEEEPEPQPRKRRGGRPKGSRNKKTLERLAQEAQEAQGQGGPSESAPEAPAEESTIPEASTEAIPEDLIEDYDDNTEPEAGPEIEDAPAESAPEPELTGVPDTEEEPEPQPKKRRGGRPKGSRNKKTLERLAQEAQEQGGPTEPASDAPAEGPMADTATEGQAEEYSGNTGPASTPDIEEAPAESVPEAEPAEIPEPPASEAPESQPEPAAEAVPAPKADEAETPPPATVPTESGVTTEKKSASTKGKKRNKRQELLDRLARNIRRQEKREKTASTTKPAEKPQEPAPVPAEADGAPEPEAVSRETEPVRAPSADPVPTGPAEAVEPTELTEPAEPAESSAPVEPTGPANPVIPDTTEEPEPAETPAESPAEPTTSQPGPAKTKKGGKRNKHQELLDRLARDIRKRNPRKKSAEVSRQPETDGPSVQPAPVGNGGPSPSGESDEPDASQSEEGPQPEPSGSIPSTPEQDLTPAPDPDVPDHGEDLNSAVLPTLPDEEGNPDFRGTANPETPEASEDAADPENAAPPVSSDVDPDAPAKRKTTTTRRRLTRKTRKTADDAESGEEEEKKPRRSRKKLVPKDLDIFHGPTEIWYLERRSELGDTGDWPNPKWPPTNPLVTIFYGETPLETTPQSSEEPSAPNAQDLAADGNTEVRIPDMNPENAEPPVMNSIDQPTIPGWETDSEMPSAVLSSDGQTPDGTGEPSQDSDSETRDEGIYNWESGIAPWITPDDSLDDEQVPDGPEESSPASDAETPDDGSLTPGSETAPGSSPDDTSDDGQVPDEPEVPYPASDSEAPDEDILTPDSETASWISPDDSMDDEQVLDGPEDPSLAADGETPDVDSLTPDSETAPGISPDDSTDDEQVLDGPEDPSLAADGETRDEGFPTPDPETAPGISPDDSTDDGQVPDEPGESSPVPDSETPDDGFQNPDSETNP